MNRNQPILCIPRVSGNITKKYVKEVFDKLSWGETVSISILNKQKSRIQQNSISLNSSCIFITLNWNKNAVTDSIKTKLLNNDSIKLVYNDIVFWKIYAKNNIK